MFLLDISVEIQLDSVIVLNVDRLTVIIPPRRLYLN